MPQSNQQSEGEELKLSPTVREASRSLQKHEPVSAAVFAKDILERHPEHAGQKASAVILDEMRADHKRPVQAWLKDIRTLFDLSRAPELHGRLVILGLSILEKEVTRESSDEAFRGKEQDVIVIAPSWALSVSIWLTATNGK